MAKPVLLFDSDLDRLQTSQSWLEGHGFEVRPAWTFQQVHKILEESAPPVVVIEPILDGIDGFELCRAILRIYEDASPVVLLASTQTGGEQLRIKALSVGAHGLFERPKMDDQLILAIASATDPGSNYPTLNAATQVPDESAAEPSPPTSPQPKQAPVAKPRPTQVMTLPVPAHKVKEEPPAPLIAVPKIDLEMIPAPRHSGHRGLLHAAGILAVTALFAGAAAAYFGGWLTPKPGSPEGDAMVASQRRSISPATERLFEVDRALAVESTLLLEPDAAIDDIVASQPMLPPELSPERRNRARAERPRGTTLDRAGASQGNVDVMSAATAGVKPPASTPTHTSTRTNLGQVAADQPVASQSDPTPTQLTTASGLTAQPATQVDPEPTGAAPSNAAPGDDNLATRRPARISSSATTPPGLPVKNEAAQDTVPRVTMDDRPGASDLSKTNQPSATAITTRSSRSKSTPAMSTQRPTTPEPELQVAPPLLTEMVPDVAPQLIESSRTDPVLPLIARRKRAGGEVVLSGMVGLDGRLSDLQVVEQPSPAFGLGRAALKAVEKWRYEPATRNGRTMEAPITIRVMFQAP